MEAAISLTSQLETYFADLASTVNEWEGGKSQEGFPE